MEHDHPVVKHARYYDILMACKVLASLSREDFAALNEEQQKVVSEAADRISLYTFEKHERSNTL